MDRLAALCAVLTQYVYNDMELVVILCFKFGDVKPYFLNVFGNVVTVMLAFRVMILITD